MIKYAIDFVVHIIVILLVSLALMELGIDFYVGVVILSISLLVVEIIVEKVSGYE